MPSRGSSFPFRDTIFLIIVALMMVPVQVAFLPVLQLFKPFGLTQGYIGIWLAHTAFALPFGIFLLRNFFITLPAGPDRGGPDRRLVDVRRVPDDRRARCPCPRSRPTGSSSSCGSGTTC